MATEVGDGAISKDVAASGVRKAEGLSAAHRFPDTCRAATHDTDQQHYVAFARRTVQFLGLQLQHRFPGVTILNTPGNNDDDCGDDTIDANGTFLSDTSEVASQLAGGDDSFVSEWKSLDSFTGPIPRFRMCGRLA